MTDQTQSAVDHTATIEYLFEGVIVDPARLFGEAKAGRKLAVRDGQTVWAIAARDSLRRNPAIIRLEGEK